MEDFSEYNSEGTTLREMQLRLLHILVEIDKVCKENDIRYWIDFGTLLGAVRHGGFIPWDDDIDITMPTEDYKKFMKIAPQALPKDLFLQTPQTDPSYKMLLSKVRDYNSFFVTPHEDFKRDYNKGLYIDIFEAVNYPTVSPKFQKRLMRWFNKIAFFYSVKQDVTIKNHIASVTFPIIKLFLCTIWGILCLKPKNKIGYEKRFNPYGNSYRREVVFPLSSIEFEGHTFPAPNDTNAYLKSIYKDYMQIPPKEKRVTHLIYVDIKANEG